MRIFILLASIVILTAAGCGTQERAGANEADTSRVFATVGNVDITERMINEELNLIPPYQRSSFESPEGKRLLLNHIIERELLLQEAENLGLENDSFVIAQVELAMQQVDAARDRALIQTYYQQQVVDQVQVSEEDIQAYYEDHLDDIYHQEPQVKVSQVLVSSPGDTAAVLAALDSGEPFETVVEEMSQHEPTRSAGGNLGWVTLNSPMPYLGQQEEIVRSLFEGEVDDVLGPFSTSMGYHFFKITEKKEEGSRPLDEVRESIENTLRPTLVNSYFEETVIPSLRESYGVTVNEEAFLPDESVSADSLFQSAQNMMETNPQTAVEYYNLFIRRFPDHPNAHQAQFLIGFTLSEYMRDYEAAEMAFQQLIDNYPESDFVDDAQWMIENMGIPPESLFIDTVDEVEGARQDTGSE
ncbi:MAG: peptidyl-prolyl cis-trans isomerase [Candidatus Fermentibacteraceae bacterium]|nr:peptidyl-prolyl cis-trans isomerase [Candidatus Fermentibacteraceae bacterium]MBN2608280.1 peptidyl-prolyl cis-trans isomerase [Candidatus Fermentibacteraceae bacterium]